MHYKSSCSEFERIARDFFLPDIERNQEQAGAELCQAQPAVAGA